MNVSADDLLFNRILGIMAAGIPASVVAADLPTCPSETIEVAVVTPDVIALSSAAAFGDEHTNIGQTAPAKKSS